MDLLTPKISDILDEIELYLNLKVNNIEGFDK